jgi:hypothetical protein
VSALRRLFSAIDGPDPASCVELLAAELRFSVVFSTGPAEARDFAGDRQAFDDYLAERGAPAWTHHVVAESAHHMDGREVELVLGETRRDGAIVASFVAAVRLTPGGLIDRYIVGRSPNALFGLA